MSPDGLLVAVSVTRVDLDANRYRSAIWVVPADPAAGDPHQLTSGTHADAHPRWSPDGARLAFVRTREGPGDETASELRVVPVKQPGEASLVATSPEAIVDVDWSPDGRRLVWCARVRDADATAKDRDREPRRITTLLTRLDDVGWTTDRRTQVFVAAADGTEPARQVTSGPFEHHAPRWSPDGETLVLCAGRHDGWDLDQLVDLWLLGVDADDAELRRITDTDRAWSHPAWSPDGQRIAALAVDAREGWRNTKPYVLDVESGKAVDVAPAVDRTFAPMPGEQAPVWIDDSTLLASREDRGTVGVLRLAADGGVAPEDVTPGRRWVVGFDHRGGTLATVVTTSSELPELYVDGVRRTTATAPFHRSSPSRAVEHFVVRTSAEDADIDAWFVAPPDGRERWPLIVSIHGGPMTQFGERWFDEWQLWSSAGFAVVGCNPHGSSGREEAWGRAIRSPLAAVDAGSGWGGVDADDILAVVDATLERWPRIDVDRVGIHGGSYGGYMTSWLCARTDRFAAGCSERAVNNLLSEEWSSDFGGSFWRELGVSHLDHPEEYLRMSPTTYVKDLQCPMLILHSEDDLRCNVEQADALFVALRLLGRDVEYWRFPAESHELSRSGTPKHRIRRAELILDFFGRTLGVSPSR